MRNLPTGTVTFLFSDIEGSTKMLRELGDAYAAALAEHRRLLRDAFERHGGVEVDTQGDAFFVAFSSAPEALRAAADGQAALADGPVRVRMGLHTGHPSLTEEGYVGLDVHRAARIAASAHGGQVVVSAALGGLLGEDTVLLSLGEHRLKDFPEPVALYQLGLDPFPPLRTVANTNLPRPASSFVGRNRERAEVAALLRGPARLVTLVGPGGCGKTRLAIESASEAIAEFPAGVWWVGLETLRDPALVLLTVANALGADGNLASYIGKREMLVLLDNFEQVADAAPSIADLLEACPHLTLMVTSRELLRVRAETAYPVQPLAATEAVDLFCVRGGIEPSEAIAELCRRLDHIPLAIELAAARTRVMSPERIVERLAERLDLFLGGRDADPRQLTLRATIEWSHDLLPEGERTLFARLAIFVGGCSLEAAEGVCDADLDALQSLVDKSLVRQTDDRFWMLESIREFALERLQASGELDELGGRHFEFFLRLARSLNLTADTDDRQRTDLVPADQDNFRAALDRATSNGDTERALLLTLALEEWLAAFVPVEGLRRFDALLGVDADLAPGIRARALRARGGAKQMLLDDTGAEDDYQASRAIFREAGDDLGVAELGHRLALISLSRGDTARARELVGDAWVAFDGAGGGSRYRAINMRIQGDIEWIDGNRDRAIELVLESGRIAEEMGFAWWALGSLCTAAEYAVRLGRLDETEAWARSVIPASMEIEYWQPVFYGLGVLAWAATGRGDTARAGRLWGAIEALERTGRTTGGWPQERDEYEAAVVRADDPDFEAARRAGRNMTIDDIVRFAMDSDRT